MQKIVNMLLNYYQKELIVSNFVGEIKTYQDEIKRLNIKKDKLLELNIEGALSNKEFRDKNDLFNQKIENLIQKINDLNSLKTRNQKATEPTQLKKSLMLKVKSQAILDHLISLLLDHVLVSPKINTLHDLSLKIFLTYENKKDSPFLEKTYSFKRGYNTKCTKRYKVNYEVKVYS